MGTEPEFIPDISQSVEDIFTGDCNLDNILPCKKKPGKEKYRLVKVKLQNKVKYKSSWKSQDDKTKKRTAEIHESRRAMNEKRIKWRIWSLKGRKKEKMWKITVFLSIVWALSLLYGEWFAFLMPSLWSCSWPHLHRQSSLVKTH